MKNRKAVENRLSQNGYQWILDLPVMGLTFFTKNLGNFVSFLVLTKEGLTRLPTKKEYEILQEHTGIKGGF